MRYIYYPGCSLESTSLSYDESMRWLFKALGSELVELPDWNCCGATQYMSVKETVSVTISARNLALAEQMKGDLVVPCSSCFMTLNKANQVLKANPIAKAKVDQALRIADLEYNCGVRVRHPLEVLVNDFGYEAIGKLAERKFEGLKIAPYYGCQIVRLKDGFDDLEVPMTMDKLFAEFEVESVYFPFKVRCCGGMLMTTYEDVALKLNYEILKSAAENGADCIVTTCPLCQINLECYQSKIRDRFGTRIEMPILFFTQLLGLGLGAGKRELGLQRHIVPFNERAEKLVEA